MNGEDVYGQHFVENGFSTPVLVPETKGLRIKIPNFDFTLDDVVKETDPDTLIDVILVRRQNVQKMPLKYFVDCFFEEPRREILNSLSFEFSKTRLSEIVSPPHVVSELCLVENIWPDEIDEEGPGEKPNVQKYCIMSMAESYTDFHVDFGGSSVWYHVLWGEKVFYLIAPTPENLDKYWEWHSLEDNRNSYFPDYLEKSALMKINDEDIAVPPVYRLKVFAGQTIFLPSGWIHAVFTPQDSLVFGGNFLTKLTVPIQLRFAYLYHCLSIVFIEWKRKQKQKTNFFFPTLKSCTGCWLITFSDHYRMIDDIKYQYLPEVSLISTKNHQLLIKELDKLIKTSIPKNYRDSTKSPSKGSSSSPGKPSTSPTKKRGRSKKQDDSEKPLSPQGFRPVGSGIAAQMMSSPLTPPKINPVIDKVVSYHDKKDGFSHLIGLPPVKKVQKQSIEEKLLSPLKSTSKRRKIGSGDEDESSRESEPTTDFDSTDTEDTLPRMSSNSGQTLIKNRSKRSIKPNRRFMSSEEDCENDEAVDADREQLIRINKTISGSYISNFDKSDKSESSDYCPSEGELKVKKSRKVSRKNDPSWKSGTSPKRNVGKSQKKASSSSTNKVSTSRKKSSASLARERLAKRLGIK